MGRKAKKAKRETRAEYVTVFQEKCRQTHRAIKSASMRELESPELEFSSSDQRFAFFYIWALGFWTALDSRAELRHVELMKRKDAKEAIVSYCEGRCMADWRDFVK